MRKHWGKFYRKLELQVKLFIRILRFGVFDLGEGGVGGLLELKPVAAVEKAPGAIEEEVEPEKAEEGPENIVVDKPGGDRCVGGGNAGIAVVFDIIFVRHFRHPLAFDIWALHQSRAGR